MSPPMRTPRLPNTGGGKPQKLWVRPGVILFRLLFVFFAPLPLRSPRGDHLSSIVSGAPRGVCRMSTASTPGTLSLLLLYLRFSLNAMIMFCIII